MEYAVVVLLSLLTAGAAIGQNKAIKVENIQDVCAAVNGVSQHIETSLPESKCVHSVNASNACKNCLDSNCSIVVRYFGFRIALASEVQVLPCHDGNLDVPVHVFASRILDANGQELFARQSSQSFDDRFEVSVRAFFFTFSVPVDLSVIIDNQGDGIFVQVDALVYGSRFVVFPPTFIPIKCSVVDRSVCFSSISSET